MTTLRLYLRRSKNDEGKQEFSLDVQRRGCLSFAPTLAQRLGVKLSAPVEYVDDGIAGDDFVGRKGLARLLAETKAGDIIIARDQSRVGRDALEVTLAIRRLTQETGALVWYYADDTEAKCGNAMEQFVTYAKGFGGQHELEAIRSRTKEAIRDRVKLGFSGGGACYGYRQERIIDPTDPARKKGRTRLHVVPEEAEVIGRIFRLYLDGDGFKATAALLNEEGVPAPQAGRRESGSWAAGCVREVLRRERYRGVYVHGRKIRERKGTSRPSKRAPEGTVLRIELPEWRIVDDVAWYGVQAQMVARSSWRDTDPRKRPAPWPKYALSGVARCSCGYAIGVVRKYRPTKGFEPAYGCSANRWRGKSVCAVSFAQGKDEVEERMVEYLKRTLFNPSAVEDYVAQVRAELERQLATPPTELAGLETELRRLEQEKTRLIKLAATTDDDPDIANEVNSRRQRIAQLQAQIAGARQVPGILRDKLDTAEARVRERMASLRALLSERGEGARRLYQTLFPTGLRFTHVVMAGHAAWRIQGMAEPFAASEVTPPGTRQRCTWRFPCPSRALPSPSSHLCSPGGQPECPRPHGTGRSSQRLLARQGGLCARTVASLCPVSSP